MAEYDCNAESEYHGRVRVRVRWPSTTAMPSPSTMAESDCNAESEYNGRVRLQCRVRARWPSPSELRNHPGRVLMKCRIRLNFGRVELAEPEWTSWITLGRVRLGRMDLAEF